MPQQLMATRERVIGIFAQCNPEVEVPAKEDLYSIGCRGQDPQLWRMPDGGVRLILQGVVPDIMGDLFSEGKLISDEIDRLEDQGDPDVMEVQEMTRSIRTQFQSIIKITPSFSFHFNWRSTV